MHIYLPSLTPQGAEATVHRLQSVTAMVNEPVKVTLHSFVSESAIMPMWCDSYEVPGTLFDAGLSPETILAFLVSDAGPFMGGALIDDPTTLEAVKTKIKVRINFMRQQVMDGGVWVAGVGVIDTTANSIRNIMGSVTMATIAGPSFSIGWRLKDNTDVTLDQAGMIGLGATTMTFVDACMRRAWELKAEVDAAETVEDAYAVALGDWPINTAPIGAE